MKYLMWSTVFALLFISCAVAPQLSPMQQREITTHVIGGSYEDTYRAALTVLQDQGYVIKNTDMQSGLIVANTDRAAEIGSQLAQALFFGYVVNKGSEVEVSCLVNKILEDRTELRMNIQEVVYGQSSAWSGSSKQNSKQILDPEIYRNLFSQIEIEVQRRRAIAATVPTNPAVEPDSTRVPDDASLSDDVDELFANTQEVPVYLDILSTAKGLYLLVKQENDKPMEAGQNFDIVRLEQEENETKEIYIGYAKVVQIRDENTALKFFPQQENTILSTEFKLKYRVSNPK